MVLHLIHVMAVEMPRIIFVTIAIVYGAMFVSGVVPISFRH